MQLKFDRMFIEPDTIIPISAKVVDAPGYAVDRQGRILGKGHAVRDVVEWSIPILWPIDLINLPRRGPRPVLREETRLTLKVMDDLGVPITTPSEQAPSGLLQRAPTVTSPASCSGSTTYRRPPDLCSSAGCATSAVRLLIRSPAAGPRRRGTATYRRHLSKRCRLSNCHSIDRFSVAPASARGHSAIRMSDIWRSYKPFPGARKGVLNLNLDTSELHRDDC
jgi:hypothetical protein